MTTNRPVAVIVGGGIGGLVAALCLDVAGLSPIVYESAREIRALGVGINLLPHAVRILVALGLGERLAACGIATGELRYVTKRGEEIWAEPRGLDAGYRWPQYSIHRGQLQLLLLGAVRERLGHDCVHVGHHLSVIDRDAMGVTARFVDRRTGAVVGTARGDLLIGADGIHSAVRAHFYPDEAPPTFSGRLLWRATTIARPFLTGQTMIMAGHANQKFVAYPIANLPDGRQVINWIAERRITPDAPPTAPDWNRVVPPATFLPFFAAWRFPWLDIPALIAGADAVYEFPMSDRDPLDRWSFGRVTLLGDAAHPMYPVGSNGASQAILDASALAGALRGGHAGDDPIAALSRYEAQRLGPTSRIVMANRQQGPEAVMQIVEERAPDGFQNLDEIISPDERHAIAAHYKHVAGFDPDALNRLGDALFSEPTDA